MGNYFGFDGLTADNLVHDESEPGRSSGDRRAALGQFQPSQEGGENCFGYAAYLIFLTSEEPLAQRAKSLAGVLNGSFVATPEQNLHNDIGTLLDLTGPVHFRLASTSQQTRRYFKG